MCMKTVTTVRCAAGMSDMFKVEERPWDGIKDQFCLSPFFFCNSDGQVDE